MEENKEEQKNINTEEIKEETKSEVQNTTNTENEKKQEAKNVNFKKEANEAKNFITNIFKTPYSEMKKITDNSKPYLKIVIAVFVIWVVAECIGAIIGIFRSFSHSYYSNIMSYFADSFSSMFSVLIAILVPVIVVALLSGIIYLFMQNKKKHYLTIVSTITIAKIPVVLASILSLFTSISSEVSKITSSFSSFCSVISAILVYYAIKALYSEEDDNKVFKTYLIVMAIYYGIALVLKFFNLYI